MRSCCGNGSNGSRPAGPPLHKGAASPAPLPYSQTGVCFEYVGATALTVIGPISGRRYRFQHPRARVMVHPADRYALATIAQLRLVSSLRPAE